MPARKPIGAAISAPTRTMISPNQNGMPAAPPAAEHDDPAADPEEERCHPGRADEPWIEEASQTTGRRRRAVVDLRRLVVLDDRGHFCLAHLSKASGSITTTRERIKA